MHGMHGYLLDFLTQLEELLPPPANCHHGLCRARYGSDEHGWTDRLALQLNDGGKFYCYFLDEADLRKPQSKLVLEVLLAHGNRPPRAQLGVAACQFAAGGA